MNSQAAADKVEELSYQLKDKLYGSVQRNPVSGMLLSGGLDTSVLAAINSNVKAITVSLESHGKDSGYAALIAKLLNIEHYQVNVGIDEAIDSIPEIIRILKTFDPAIPNDIVVYFGLRQAKKMGINQVITGDGADELLGGYSFMYELDDLNNYIKRISSLLQFSSNQLGEFFDIHIKQPYLSKDFIDFCLQITGEFKIKQENNMTWGKWILRKAFENMLPREIIWQDKRPLEVGSGMEKIREIINSKITDELYQEKSRVYPVKFINKEHMYYYEIYKNEIGAIPVVKEGQKNCPGCGAGIKKEAFHCWVCGWVEKNIL